MGACVSFRREDCIVINTVNGWIVVGEDGWRSPVCYALARQAKKAAEERYG